MIVFITSAPYMDDSVSNQSSPLYFALGQSSRIFGPVFGFLLAFFCLKYYVQPGVDPGISLNDPRWIGAWWMGLVVIAFILLLYSCLVSLFPRQLPSRSQNPPADTNNTGNVKNLWYSIKMLLKNQALVLSTLSALFYFTGMIGFYSVQPKYMEHVFRIDKAASSKFVSVSKSFIVVGVLSSGLLMRKLRPTAAGVSLAVTVLRVLGTLLFVALLVVRCPAASRDLPGTLVSGYHHLVVENECNLQCGCTAERFEPICLLSQQGKTRRTYFSPCHAGCDKLLPLTSATPSSITSNWTRQIPAGNKKSAAYTNCKCIDGDTDAVLIPGLCESGCGHHLTIFLVLTSLSSLIHWSASIPHFMILLRSVPDSEKTMALGFSGTVSALAFGAGPLAVGALVDGMCLVWERSCGERGACWLYDVDMLRYSLIGFVLVFWSLTCITQLAVYMSSHTINLYQDHNVTSFNQDRSTTQQLNTAQKLDKSIQPSRSMTP